MNIKLKEKDLIFDKIQIFIYYYKVIIHTTHREIYVDIFQ